jgi:signal transduction histidine kinase
MRIQTKLTLLMLGVTLPAVFLTAAIGYRANTTSVRREADILLTSTRDARGAQVETYLRTLRKNSILLAQEPALLEISNRTLSMISKLDAPSQNSNWIEDFKQEVGDENVANGLLSADPKLLSLQKFAHCLRANKLAESNLLRLHQSIKPAVERMLKTYGLAEFSIIDAESGVLIFSSSDNTDVSCDFLLGPLSGTKVGRTIQGALLGQTKFTDFERYAPDRYLPKAFLCTPIMEGTTIKGILRVSLPADSLFKLTSNNNGWENDGLGETGETVIIGEDGVLRSEARIANQDFKKFSNFLNDQKNIELVKKSKSSVLSTRAISESMNGIESIVETQDYRGEPVIASVAPIASQDLRWKIVTKRDLSEVNQPLTEIKKTTLALLAALVLGQIVVAWAIARSFTKPIQKIIDAAARFGEGEAGVRVNMTRTDEFGQLGKSFDKMIEQDEKVDSIADGIRRNIVHDLKTPVTVIGESVEMRDEMLSAISEQTDHLLDDLKDILSPINENYIPTKTEFDLSILVERVAKAEKHTGRAANHLIIVKGADLPVYVRADRRKIRRVIENLISNAVKYSPGESKKVTVTIEPGLNDTALHITDEGLGMKPEDLSKVMNEGGRIKEHTDRGIEGTGLGLGSVQMILKAHDGELMATSKPGVGSTFSLRFPKL